MASVVIAMLNDAATGFLGVVGALLGLWFLARAKDGAGVAGERPRFIVAMPALGADAGPDPALADVPAPAASAAGPMALVELPEAEPVDGEPEPPPPVSSAQPAPWLTAPAVEDAPPADEEEPDVAAAGDQPADPVGAPRQRRRRPSMPAVRLPRRKGRRASAAPPGAEPPPADAAEPGDDAPAPADGPPGTDADTGAVADAAVATPPPVIASPWQSAPPWPSATASPPQPGPPAPSSAREPAWKRLAASQGTDPQPAAPEGESGQQQQPPPASAPFRHGSIRFRQPGE